jgi:hypothetical protein
MRGNKYITESPAARAELADLDVSRIAYGRPLGLMANISGLGVYLEQRL